MNDDYWGLCPHCHKTDGYINIGRGHWFYCREHQTRWWAGSNLFSSWRHETEDEQRARYDAMQFDQYTKVEPWSAPHESEATPLPVNDDGEAPF